MTAKEALSWGAKKLSRHKVGIPTAVSGKNRFDSVFLDTEILLAHVLKKSKENLLIHPEIKLTAAQTQKYRDFISRRATHEPVAYITEKKDFFGLGFFVDKNVLIPRPETELLVEEAMREFQIPKSPAEAGSRLFRLINQKKRRDKFQILDIGTGSGAIAIALAKNLPNAKITTTDISSAALRIAKQNARYHGVAKKIKFIKTDLLPEIPKSPAKAGSRLFHLTNQKKRRDKFQIPVLVIANLPYLPTRVWKNAMPDVRKFEPKSALLGGHDGLDIIKKLLLAIRRQNLRGTVLLECDPSQETKLPQIIKKMFPSASVETKKDLAGLFRIVKIEIIPPLI